MSKPRLLDLFCGAGGAAMGYHRAGFEVVGVDIKPQPHYPFKFVQADALGYLAALRAKAMIDTPGWGIRFEAIHASPPCQAYSSATADPSKHPDLYALTRAALMRTGKPWVIENVIGAPYHHGIVLCGSMFGLTADDEWIQRHRNFEASFAMLQPQCQHRTDKRACTITGKTFTTEVREYKHSRHVPFELAKRLMDIDWMTRQELVLAIPPAYTEYIGRHLLEAVREVAA